MRREKGSDGCIYYGLLTTFYELFLMQKIFTIAAEESPWRVVRDVYIEHAPHFKVETASEIENWATEKAAEFLKNHPHIRHALYPGTRTFTFHIENGSEQIELLTEGDSELTLRQKIKNLILEHHLDYLFARSSILDILLDRACRGHESRQWGYLQGERAISVLTLALPPTYTEFLTEEELLRSRDFLQQLGHTTNIEPTPSHSVFLYVDEGLERLVRRT